MRMIRTWTCLLEEWLDKIQRCMPITKLTKQRKRRAKKRRRRHVTLLR